MLFVMRRELSYCFFLYDDIVRVFCPHVTEGSKSNYYSILNNFINSLWQEHNLLNLCMGKHWFVLSIEKFYEDILVKEGHRGSLDLYVSHLLSVSLQCMMQERAALDSSITISTLTALYHL